MKVTTMLSVVLAMGLSVATWASSASAAVRDAAAGREGTVTRCLAEAHRHYPGKYYDWGKFGIMSTNAACLTLAFPSKARRREAAPLSMAP